MPPFEDPATTSAISMDSSVVGTLAPMISPVYASSLEGATEVVFLSIVLHSILFISSEGELRVNPGCGAAREVPKPERMLRHCLPYDSSESRLCFFASWDRKFTIATDYRNGMLRTIRTPSILNAPSNFTCTAFRETNVHNGIVSLTSCPGTAKARDVFFSGRRLRDRQACHGTIGPFSQTLKKSKKTRHSYVMTGLSNVQATLRLCRNNPVRTCPEKVQSSYPLNVSLC